MMTKAEAAYCMRTFTGEMSCRGCRYYGTENGCLAKEAHQMAVKALEQQDLLFRTNLLKDCESCKTHLTFLSQEKTKGIWIKSRTAVISYKCSKCGNTINYEDYPEASYCNKCGSEMIKEEE